MTQKPDDQASEFRAVRLAERLAFSSSFQPIFDEGMALVDETAAYLDGEGRRAVRHLGKNAAALYAAESMRLTTRLMQVASWLLLQRAANQGDMSRGQVEAEKVKVRLDGFGPATEAPGFPDLPEAFRRLAERAALLERRIALLDREIYGAAGGEAASSAPNPVGEQHDLLRTAFAV